MSKRNWRIFVRDILDCIEKIEAYLADLSYDRFLRDDRTKDAVVRNLEVIGEAAKQIPDHIKAKYPEIPWQRVAV